MSRANLVTKPYEPEVFISGVFTVGSFGSFSLASDSLSGIVFEPEMFGFETENQTLNVFTDLTNKVLPSFYSIIGPQSLAQYSLHKQQKIACLARYDLFYRNASPSEIELDLDHYGEQVVGPSVEERPDLIGQYPTFTFFDDVHYFTGPPRMIKSVFNTRIKTLEGGKSSTAFSDHLPLNEINGWFTELDEIANEQRPETGTEKFLQTYFLFIFDRGEIRLQILAKPGIETGKSKLYGIMTLDNGKLLFLPEGKREAAIDFTENLKR